MLPRLCKLCNRGIDSVINLRRYTIFPTMGQDQNDTKNKSINEENRVPLIICKRPEFNFYKGTTYSKFENIPLASKGWHHSKSAGDYFTILPDYEDKIEDDDFLPTPQDFEGFDLHPKLIENLSYNNICAPTEIQSLAISKILTGEHSVISAETGCGKTIAYLLPMLNQILRWKGFFSDEDKRPNSPLGLIITPSRELADQIGKVAKKLVKDLNITVRVITGGRTKRISANPPVGDVDLLIGSFGVVSKMTTSRIFKLNYVRHVVLDEAHALFDVTFDEKLAVFLQRIHFDSREMADESSFPNSSQLTLVSATKGPEMPEYFGKIVSAESFLDVTTKNFQRVMIPQKFMRVAGLDKPMTLLKLVKRRAMKKHPFIVFSNDSATCDWISLFLNEFGIRTVHLNGEMPMVIRKGKFSSFQRGEFTVLSATNAGARGLDTVHVQDVINYEFPMDTADYIHRCGRTGRIGSKGECKVTNLISRRFEIDLTQKMERAARRRRPIPIFNMLEEAAKREVKEIEEITGIPRKRTKPTAPRKTKKVSRAKKLTEAVKKDSQSERL